MSRQDPLVLLLGRDLAAGEARTTFVARLAELGFGRCEIAHRRTDAADLAAVIGRLAPDVIVCSAAADGQRALTLTRSVPIVVWTGDTGAAGLEGAETVATVQLPADAARRRFALLAAIVPGLAVVGGIADDTRPAGAAARARAELAAREAGLRIVVCRVTGTADLPAAFIRMDEAGAGAAMTFQAPATERDGRRVAALARAAKLPLLSTLAVVRSGGLLAHDPDPVALYRFLAECAERLLAGESPGTLGALEAPVMRTALHRGTAAALGFAIPPEILATADLVIDVPAPRDVPARRRPQGGGLDGGVDTD